jgi:Flp pilus assembly protein TadD
LPTGDSRATCLPLPDDLLSVGEQVMTEDITPRTRRISRRRRQQYQMLVLMGGGVVMFCIVALIAREMYRARHRQPATQSAISEAEAKLPPAIREMTIALRMNPSDVDLNRKMAIRLEMMRSRKAIDFRRRVVELQPDSVEDHLALANTALRMGDAAAAKEALANVPDEGKNTTAWHEAATKLAVQTQQLGVAEAELAKAVQLNPENELNQLNLAILRLNSLETNVRNGARKMLEGFSEKKEFQRAASRALLTESVREKVWPRALVFAQRLRTAPGATLGDALPYLALLRDLKRVEAGWLLAQLKIECSADPARASQLISWMNRNGLAQQALEWIQQLPGDLILKPPMPVAIAESYDMLGQWIMVKTMAEGSDWDQFDYRRMALLSRALREEGSEAESRIQWILATEAAGKNSQALLDLNRLATAWKWEGESVELLWTLARTAPNPMPALQLLNKVLGAKGDTRQLRDVAVRTLELMPKSLSARNNLAYYCFLLKSDLDRGKALARENYEEEPNNPGVISTYSFGLHLEGKDEEARRLLSSLDPKILEQPSQALCYALVLAGTGANEEARKYFELASRGDLLPEEKALIPKGS